MTNTSIAVEMPDEIWAVTFYEYSDGRRSGAWYSNRQPDATEADVRFIRADLYADQARELAKRIDEFGPMLRSGNKYMNARHELLWSQLLDDINGLLRSIAETKPS
jgi:hypothetical protein